jgi:hypothetical protein
VNNRKPLRRWRELPRAAKVKTLGYVISVVSVLLLAVVSWKNAEKDPLLAACLFGGAATSILGQALRWWSYEVEEATK